MSTFQAPEAVPPPQNPALLPEGARPLRGAKRATGRSVHEETLRRVRRTFADFPNVYVSFSGGKDSGVVLEIAANEARRLGRALGVLIVDLEAGYRATEDFVRTMLVRHADVLEPYWVCLPLNMRNAVSSIDPQWTCWDPEARDRWVRPAPAGAVTDPAFFDFYAKHTADNVTPDGGGRYMEFEEFVPAFGHWYAARHGNRLTACLVGIRSDESLNRYRTIATLKKRTHEGLRWTTRISGGPNLYNTYPIYDWQTRDIWIYNGRFDVPYNRIYDLMHQAGLTIHSMRLCQPYGDDQKLGLWLYHILEPRTWSRVVARVSGANFGAKYSTKTGNISGRITITCPDGMTWFSYAQYLLNTMPEQTAEHFRNKIARFIFWYSTRGYPDGIPDDGPMDKSTPSWKRVCKVLLAFDYWCKEFAMAPPANAKSYEKHQERMRAKRQEWKFDGTL
ncbi:DUF3440 domain-containing protein [Kitasatospora sp. NPDC092948]|uniref:DUF3440 domain-containing protein n=1 Tax=Kitasatospora sp. NPDC092948 TaxID=3364088 RepID=UPI00382052A5